MRVDQAGQASCAGEIDHIRAGGNLRGGGIGDAFDAIAADENDLVTAGRIGFAVDERASAHNCKRVQHRIAAGFLRRGRSSR